MLGLAASLAAGCSTPPRLSTDTLTPLRVHDTADSVPPGGDSTPTSLPPSTNGLPPSPTGLPSTVASVGRHTKLKWGNWRFDQVPPLAISSERGTGCGSTGNIGEVIPDGVWNVLVGDGSGADRFFTATNITVDVRCVYTGLIGQQRWNAACAPDPAAQACVGQSPGWFVVNASRRLRTMPVSPSLTHGVGALGTSPCPAAPNDLQASNAPWRFMDSWIIVDVGIVTTVVSACPTD